MAKIFTLYVCKHLLIVAATVLMSTYVIAEERCKTGQVSYHTMPVQLLTGVHERDYAIYLPKSYETKTTKRYPVLYLLHGGADGTFRDWPVHGQLEDYANEIIASGMAREMIIVCPDGRYKNNSMWFNMLGWSGEDYFTEELIPFIDKTYRTVADRQHRAVAGLSMGGGGSIFYGLSHPDMFAAVYAISSYIEPLASVIPPGTEWSQIEVEKNNPIGRIENATPEQVAAWSQVKWFIDCGDEDFTYDMNSKLVSALRRRGIPYQLRIRDGGHTWQYWRGSYYSLLPFISQSFLAE